MSRVLGRAMARTWIASDWAGTTVPLPTGDSHVNTAGTNPARVLVLGSGISVGFGVLAHDLALPGHLARRLSDLTGRAMDIDIVTDREMTISMAVAALPAIDLPRYDSIVLTVGLLDAILFVSPDDWTVRLDALLTGVTERTTAHTEVFVIAIPPLATLRTYPRFIQIFGSRHARLINERSAAVSRGHDRVTYLPFEPRTALDPERFRSPETYAAWADLLAPPIAAPLSRPPCPAAPGADGAGSEESTREEADRRATVDALGILDTLPEERFDRIATTARNLLGASGAALAFADHDRHWLKARFGIGASQVPRVASLCEATIQNRDVFWVRDASADDRFAANTAVADEPFLRFFAGYPVEAPNGVRVGTLCVFDTEPRDFSDADAALLRGLALMVQNELRSAPPE